MSDTSHNAKLVDCDCGHRANYPVPMRFEHEWATMDYTFCGWQCAVEWMNENKATLLGRL